MANTYDPIQDYLTQNATQIHPMITQVINDQPTAWDALGNTEFWTDEMSAIQKTWQFDRPMLAGGADPVDWADMHGDITENDDHANHITSTTGFIPPADNAIFGQTLRSFNLQAKAIWGPDLDVEQLRNKMKRAEQVQKSVTALANLIHEYKVERKRSEYYRIAATKVVCGDTYDFTPASSPTTAFPYPAMATANRSILTKPFLDMGYEAENLQGGAKNALGMVQGRPVYALITSARQASRVATVNSEIQEDFRVNDIKTHLLAPLGVKFSYGGYTFMSDDRVRRWNFKFFTNASAGQGESSDDYENRSIATIARESGNMTALLTLSAKPAAGRFYPGTQITPTSGNNQVALEVVQCTNPSTGTIYRVKRCDGAALGGDDTSGTYYFKAWVAVPQYIYTGTLLAMKRIPNPAYLTAAWEDSVLYHESVCTTMVPKPIGSVGQANFQPRDFHGNISFKVYPDKGTNPDGTFGNFRAILANGTRPDRPELGIIFRHLAAPAPSGMYDDLIS